VRHNILPITTFIFGMEADHPGVSNATVRAIRSWPPCFSALRHPDSLSGTPLYTRLQSEGRLTRPFHWLDFKSYKATYIPKYMSAEAVEDEVRARLARHLRTGGVQGIAGLARSQPPSVHAATHSLHRPSVSSAVCTSLRRGGGNGSTLIARNTPTMGEAGGLRDAGTSQQQISRGTARLYVP